MIVQGLDGAREYPPGDPSAVNADDLRTKGINALATNVTYLAIVNPTNAQVAAQVTALTKECSGVIRLLLRQLDSTAGT